MAAADEEGLTPVPATTPFEAEERVAREFGAYRAEWLDDRLFSLFREPQYIGSLIADQPIVLEGGRGTGKTTVLKGLSFRGQFARGGEDPAVVGDWSFVGLYYKVTMSHMAPFQGAELPPGRWIRLFSHYLNLIHCGLIADFLHWHGSQTGGLVELGRDAIEEVAIGLHLGEVADTAALLRAIRRSHAEFEAFINNVAGEAGPSLSMLGAPQRALAQAAVATEQLAGKRFYLLIDEYENFSDYQQRVFNTLIKESGGPLVYKVGVREEGWPQRETLNPAQRLEEPQDFKRINITDELDRGGAFVDFAAAVCRERLAGLELAGADLAALLPGLTEDAEAERLGVGPLAEEARRILRNEAPDAGAAEGVGALPDLKAYLVLEWARAHDEPVDEVARDFFERSESWDDRYGNYKHTLLYTIRAGKSGIRKYYAGWQTLCLLAANNIRFLLQLVETSLRLHIRAGATLGDPVDPAIQTTAAQEVGEKNLFQLESVSGVGHQLLRLLLGLGRIFGRLAAGGTRHRPETNQFELPGRVSAQEQPTDEQTRRIAHLLNQAVMNLALIRISANKLQAASDIADDQYLVHPMVSAFFVFSYRRKRKMTLRPLQLLALIDDHQAAIRELLGEAEDIGAATEQADDDLPDQMRLFAEYYRATS